MVKNFNIVLVLLFLISCTPIAGLRDKSTTIYNHGLQVGEMKTITILPVKDDSAVLGLSESIEAELSTSLHAQLPMVKIVSAKSFRSYLVEKDLISEYAQWRSSYEETKILSVRQLNNWSQIVESRYCLLVNRVHLSREKIKAVDAGYSGYVNDANNVWRTDLRLFAQVIDIKSGTVAWEGVGHAENIYSPKRIGHDDDWIVWNEMSPKTEKYIAPMVKMAVDGLVANITSGGSNAIRSENNRPVKQKKDIFSDY